MTYVSWHLKPRRRHVSGGVGTELLDGKDVAGVRHHHPRLRVQGAISKQEEEFQSGSWKENDRTLQERERERLRETERETERQRQRERMIYRCIYCTFLVWISELQLHVMDLLIMSHSLKPGLSHSFKGTESRGRMN